MGKKSEKQQRRRRNHVRADVIILGCSLPGIVTAHNLKKTFGDTMDIVVLDLPGCAAATIRSVPSRCNVAFHEEHAPKFEDVKRKSKEMTSETQLTETEPNEVTSVPISSNIARYYLAKYTKTFNIPLPDPISDPPLQTTFNKLFEYRNGNVVQCNVNYNDFGYLNFVERYELDQYQTFLDKNMKSLFQVSSINTEQERKKLLYFDQTTMEEHICSGLLFPTSREIMRTIVRLVCGTTAENVSLLFYLHQCFRNHSCKNHVDGQNTRFREKLLGFCRKRIAYNLLQSIADITLPTKPIKEIRSYADEQVILEPEIGETDYICNLLAMALRPDQLRGIQLENSLVNEKDVQIACEMKGGTAKKFVIQYEENFWFRDGFSGDILSVKGPIIWAMERPDVTNTGKSEKSSSLIGFLRVKDPETNSKQAVIDQLVKLFGEKAANPVQYKEKDIKEIFVPRRGDFVALRRLVNDPSPKYVEWGALDVFADGDVAAAIEAGHTAYLHLLSCLRPQALTYEDVAPEFRPIDLGDVGGITSSINIVTTTRYLLYGIVILFGIRMIRSYLRR